MNEKLQKKILLMAAEILRMHGCVAGGRICQDWSGDDDKRAEKLFDEVDLKQLYYDYELENSGGNDYWPDHMPYGDEMMTSYIFSNALREMAESINPPITIKINN